MYLGYRCFLFVILGLLFSLKTQAFPCYFTLVKDSCWTDYDVTVQVMDAANDQVLISVIVPKGKTWVRQAFTCQPGQKLFYSAQFSPTVWQGQENKVYKATSYWELPDKPAVGEAAWNLTVCFPEQFSEVPYPPTASGNCVCNTKDIPLPSAIKTS